MHPGRRDSLSQNRDDRLLLFRISKSAHHGIPPVFLLSQKFERLLVCQGN